MNYKILMNCISISLSIIALVYSITTYYVVSCIHNTIEDFWDDDFDYSGIFETRPIRDDIPQLENCSISLEAYV